MNENRQSDITTSQKKAEKITTENSGRRIYKLSSPFPSVGVWIMRWITMSVWSIKSCRRKTQTAFAICAFILWCGHPVWSDSGYNVVQMSTAAPTGTQLNFLNAISAQFDTEIVPNPDASNTYAVKIFGPNPNYQAPAPPPTTLEQALSLGSTVYVYGFAGGMNYQQNNEIKCVNFVDTLCGTATSFMLTQTSSSTFDKATCEDVSNTIINQLYQLSVSTPSFLPPTGP